MATLDTTPMAYAASAPRLLKQSPPPPVGHPSNPLTGMGSQPLVTTQSTMNTGAQPLVPGALPQSPPPPGTAIPMPKPTSFLGNTAQGTYNPVGDEGTILQGYLNQFLGSNNALMRDARTRGLEQAALSGLQNSSIAAGASQRAALEQVVPLAGQAFDLFGQREQRNWQTGERLGQQGWTSGENQLDRQQQTNLQRDQQGWTSGENLLDRQQQTNLQRDQQSWQSGERRDTQQWTSGENRLDRDQQITMTQLQDWANNQSFMREFNANLAMMPVQNTTQLLNAIAQQALDSPEVYTPDVISGLTEFFTTNYLDVLSRYFPSLYATQGGGS